MRLIKVDKRSDRWRDKRTMYYTAVASVKTQSDAYEIATSMMHSSLYKKLPKRTVSAFVK